MTKHPPALGSIYRTSTGVTFKILKIAHVEHDPWVEYQNTETKDHYSCRLPAFLERFQLVQPYRPWLTR